MEMEPECMHKLSGSGTIMELREAGAKTSVDSLGYQIRKPLSGYSLVRGKQEDLTCILRGKT